MSALHTLADLTRITGAKRRSLQLWAEAGVLKAEPRSERAGTGTHRLFSQTEVSVAIAIAECAKFQIAIGGLLRIADQLRPAIKLGMARMTLVEGGVQLSVRLCAKPSQSSALR